MLYPKIINIKKSNMIIGIMILMCILISGVLIAIDFLTDAKIMWSLITSISIVYLWVTVIYSIRRGTNIASSIMTQTLVISIFMILLDKIIGYKGWSVEMAVPIILSIANIMMFIMLLISRRNYTKYIIYHVIIFAFNLFMVILFLLNMINNIMLSVIALIISIIIAIITTIICGNDIKEELIKRFHM